VKWKAAVDNDLNKAPEAAIELSKQDQADKIVLTIKVTGLTSTEYTDLRLHTVVTEDSILYNGGNDENVHYAAMRTMIPDADGFPVTLVRGNQIVKTWEITPGTEWARDYLNAVVFVQSSGSKHVLQAAKLSLK
jgi:hypothetical protein